MKSKTIEFTKQNFEKKVLQLKTPILVDFWAPWCQPCLMMGSILDVFSEELDDKLKIGKLNTELSENQALAAKYQIQSIPNMKFFKRGKVVKTLLA